MKTINIYAALLFSIFTINISFAQSTENKETIKVSGNCSMCKNKIEKAAKTAGATSANWNEETNVLNFNYNSTISNSEKIQKAIASSGYDTQDFKADDKAYKGLMGCCKYERNASLTRMSEKKSMSDCKNMECCKDKDCCSKDGNCTDKACKDNAECKKMECCKS